MAEAMTYVCFNHEPNSERFKSRKTDEKVKCPVCKSPLGEFVFTFSGKTEEEVNEDESINDS